MFNRYYRRVVREVGKLFATTLLAKAVKGSELSLGDSVAKYVTELQKGGDILRGDARAACQSYVWIAACAAAIRRLASRKLHVAGLCSLPEFVEGWSEPRAWKAVSLFQCCHGFVARGARTPIQHSICGVNARTDHRTPSDELYRAAVATGLTWARRAGLRPGRTPCRAGRVKNRGRSDGQAPGRFIHPRGTWRRSSLRTWTSSPTMARWRMRCVSRNSPCSA